MNQSERPDDLVPKLASELSQLAYQFRGNKSMDPSQPIVQQYHKVMQKLWDLGWRGDDLFIDAELPPELMPQYFVDYWKENQILG